MHIRELVWLLLASLMFLLAPPAASRSADDAPALLPDAAEAKPIWAAFLGRLVDQPPPSPEMLEPGAQVPGEEGEVLGGKMWHGRPDIFRCRPEPWCCHPDPVCWFDDGYPMPWCCQPEPVCRSAECRPEPWYCHPEPVCRHPEPRRREECLILGGANAGLVK
jgi:hypothetical protein